MLKRMRARFLVRQYIAARYSGDDLSIKKRSRITKSLQRMSAEAIPVIAEVLSSEREKARFEVGNAGYLLRLDLVELLGGLKDADAIPTLERVLRSDDDEDVHEEAVQSLFHIAHKDSIDPLIFALNNSCIASSAAERLGELGAEKAASPIRDLLMRTEEGSDAISAINALVKLNVSDVKSIILEKLNLYPKGANACEDVIGFLAEMPVDECERPLMLKLIVEGKKNWANFVLYGTAYKRLVSLNAIEELLEVLRVSVSEGEWDHADAIVRALANASDVRVIEPLLALTKTAYGDGESRPAGYTLASAVCEVLSEYSDSRVLNAFVQVLLHEPDEITLKIVLGYVEQQMDGRIDVADASTLRLISGLPDSLRWTEFEVVTDYGLGHSHDRSYNTSRIKNLARTELQRRTQC